MCGFVHVCKGTRARRTQRQRLHPLGTVVAFGYGSMRVPLAGMYALGALLAAAARLLVGVAVGVSCMSLQLDALLLSVRGLAECLAAAGGVHVSCQRSQGAGRQRLHVLGAPVAGLAVNLQLALQGLAAAARV